MSHAFRPLTKGSNAGCIMNAYGLMLVFGVVLIVLAALVDAFS